MGKVIKKAVKVATSPLSLVGGFGLGAAGEAAKSKNPLIRGLAYAGLAAAAVYTGGAAMGLTGAALATTTATTAASAGMSGVSSAQAEQAQAQARAESQRAAREAEIMRKQALLASQKAMSARQSTAAVIANKLKNTTTGLLGDEEEKLGG